MTPMSLDEFFRIHYLSMCNYCEKFGFIFADIEEEIASVIHKHYDEYFARLSNEINEIPIDRRLRMWLSRRAMMNCKSKYTKYSWPLYFELRHLRGDGDESLRSVPECLYNFDDPESILDLKQRLPSVDPILIQYEPYGGKESVRGENSNKDRTSYCRKKKKFLTQLWQ